jgi:hypothetical protein
MADGTVFRSASSFSFEDVEEGKARVAKLLGDGV